jgi:hypothetical protein
MYGAAQTLPRAKQYATVRVRCNNRRRGATARCLLALKSLLAPRILMKSACSFNLRAISSRSGIFEEDFPMSSSKPLHLLAVCAMVGSLLPMCTIAKDCTSNVCTADETITSLVRASYQQHPELAVPNAIRVQTRGQVVYLHGNVGNGLQRDEAISLAQQVPNVKQVIASIRTSNTGG